MKAYLNHDDRSKVLMLMGFIGVFQEVEQRERLRELFGKYWADLKRAKSFMTRALEGLADNIGQEQAKKVVNMARTHDLMLVGKTAPPEDATVHLTADKFFDVCELAIGNHCVGCQKIDHESCRVYQVLSAVDVPPAETTVTDGCPYRQ